MNCCKACKYAMPFAFKEKLECKYPIPWWIKPKRRWVLPTDGEYCNAFKDKP